MKNEFKVMPWLRQTREEHAVRQAGLSDAERIEQDRKESAEIMGRLFKTSKTYRIPAPSLTRVAENAKQGLKIPDWKLKEKPTF